jgi:diacylglycerol kinase (ATP)
MNDRASIDFLFIINSKAGNNKTNFRAEIEKWSDDLERNVKIFELTGNHTAGKLKEEIQKIKPSGVVAVGGDGTVKLIAESLLQTGIPLGILPAGSANGMAKELGIEISVDKALEIIGKGNLKKIHAVLINDELCIHLSDIGFNAFIVKKFESIESRGMWSYLKAAWKVFWNYRSMQVKIETDKEEVHRQAAMVVFANATKYGTGVVINPKGSLTDGLFEIVVVRKLSFKEILKMKITHAVFDSDKTEIFQTHSVKIKARHKVHFQVDGEYLGRVNTIEAVILPSALQVIIPHN